MTPPIPQRTRLAARLKELRAGKFRSGNQFAAHIGWPQPRVSKIETGAQRPSAQDISAWVNTVGAGPEVEVELLAMLAATRFSYVTHRENVDGGLAASLAFSPRWKHKRHRSPSSSQHSSLGSSRPLHTPGNYWRFTAAR